MIQISEHTFVTSKSPIKKVLELSRIVEDVFEIIHFVLTFPKNQVVIFADINSWGEFDTLNKKIRINPIVPDRLFLTVLAHECIHAEQSYTQKTKLIERDDEYLIEFDRKLYRFKDYTTAVISPWEKEAYDREVFVAQRFADLISKSGHNRSLPSSGLEAL